MKARSVLLASGCVTALVLGAAVARAGEGTRSPVDVILQSSKTKYAFGENVVIFITLMNRSAQTMTMALSRNLFRSSNDTIELLMDGKPPHAIGLELFLSVDSVVLGPGQSVRLRYFGWWLRPGEHTVCARYAFKPEAADMPDYDGLWRGAVTSMPLTIVVQGQDQLTPQARKAFHERQEKLIGRLKDLDPEYKSRLQAIMVRYMPLTRGLLSEMLKDESPGVRGSVISSIGFLSDREFCAEANRNHDLSLIPEVIQLGKTEEEPWPKRQITVALGMASQSLSGNIKEEAICLLEQYLDDPSGQIAGLAAFSLIKIDGKRAARALRSRVSGKKALDPDFQNILVQGLFRATGKANIQEALDILEKGR